MEGEYLHRELPWVSKSKIKTALYFCPWLFYNKNILKEPEDKLSKRASVGTDTHMIFDLFWTKVKSKYIFDELEIDPTIDIEDNPVTLYFYSICMTLTPEYDREVGVLQRIFWKFSVLHASRFLYLYSLFNGNKIKIWRYFRPIVIEEFVQNEEFQIFGTIDTAFLDINKNGKETLYLADYKTGHIPASVLKGRTNKLNELSITLPPKFMFEVHFYALLYLLNKGWVFDDERVTRFVLYDEYLENGEWKKFGLGITKEEQKEIYNTKRKYLTSLQPKFKKFDELTQKEIEFNYGDMQLGIIFLTGDPDIDDPVVIKKAFNYRSLRTALLKINILRQLWFYRNYDELYLIKNMKTKPEWNDYMCPKCSRGKKCLEEIENSFKRGEI